MDTNTEVDRHSGIRGLIPFFVLIVSLGSSLQPAQAQLNAELGIKAGRTFTTVSGAELWSDPNRRTGWMLAGTARIPLSDHFMIEFSTAYVQKGARERQSIPNGSTTVTMKMNYIEFPLMVGTRWPIGDGIAGRVLAGPAVGFNMSAKRTADQPSPEAPALRDQIRRTEISAVVGAGLDININYQTITVDARYHRGLTELMKEPAGDSLQNRGMSVALGVQF